MMVVLRELRTGSWNWCKTVVQWLKVWTWHAGNWNIHCGNRPFKLQIVLNEAFSIRHPGTVGCNTAPEEWSTNSKSIFGQYCFVFFCMWNKVKRKWGWSCVYAYFFNLQSVEIYIFNCTIIYIYIHTDQHCVPYICILIYSCIYILLCKDTCTLICAWQYVSNVATPLRCGSSRCFKLVIFKDFLREVPVFLSTTPCVSSIAPRFFASLPRKVVILKQKIFGYLPIWFCSVLKMAKTLFRKWSHSRRRPELQ